MLLIMSCTRDKLNYSILSVFNWFNCFVVIFFFFRFSYNMCGESFAPVLFRFSPYAIIFNSNIVFSSYNSEESFLTPICSPWVSNFPEFLTIFLSPSNNRNFMIRSYFSCCIFKDTSIIVMKLLSWGDWACNRSSLEYLLHHLGFSLNSSPCFNFINIMFCNRPTSFTFCTITTSDKVRTLESISPSSCLIKTASFILNSMLFNPFKSFWRVSSMTSVACWLTTD